MSSGRCFKKRVLMLEPAEVFLFFFLSFICFCFFVLSRQKISLQVYSDRVFSAKMFPMKTRRLPSGRQSDNNTSTSQGAAGDNPAPPHRTLSIRLFPSPVFLFSVAPLTHGEYTGETRTGTAQSNVTGS